MNYFDAPSSGTPVTEPDAEEVSPDAMQLIQIATFNGLCRVVAALGNNGLISREQIENIHDCMTTPLEDPVWRDDPSVAVTKDVVESVLAQAITEVIASSNFDPD